MSESAVYALVTEVLRQLDAMSRVISSGFGQVSGKLDAILRELHAMHYDLCTWLAMFFMLFLIFGVIFLVLKGLELFIRVKQWWDEKELLLRLQRRKVREA